MKEEKRKTVKRKAGEERRQATDFKEVDCYLSAVVQGAARQKSGLCYESALLGRPTAISTQPKWGWGSNHHVEAAVDWCSSILLASHVYIIYTIETSRFTIQKDRSQYVLWGRTEGP